MLARASAFCLLGTASSHTADEALYGEDSSAHLVWARALLIGLIVKRQVNTKNEHFDRPGSESYMKSGLVDCLYALK
jgi:hypothetical protein